LVVVLAWLARATAVGWRGRGAIVRRRIRGHQLME
jgi:hypothetical protein